MGIGFEERKKIPKLTKNSIRLKIVVIPCKLRSNCHSSYELRLVQPPVPFSRSSSILSIVAPTSGPKASIKEVERTHGQ